MAKQTIHEILDQYRAASQTERESVTTDKDSGIVNDANLWATETMQNAKYPLEIFLRVITVSLETIKIVNSLPKLEERRG
jgi:predicted helicase